MPKFHSLPAARDNKAGRRRGASQANAVGWRVSDGLADGFVPLTPALSVGEREKTNEVHGCNAHFSNVETFHEPWRAGSVHLAQPFQGCEDPSLPTQGSLASSATLGFEAES